MMVTIMMSKYSTWSNAVNIQLSLSSGVFRSLTLFACDIIHDSFNYDDDLVKLIEAESAAVIVGDVIAGIIIITVAMVIIIGQLGNIRITCANS